MTVTSSDLSIGLFKGHGCYHLCDLSQVPGHCVRTLKYMPQLLPLFMLEPWGVESGAYYSEKILTIVTYIKYKILQLIVEILYLDMLYMTATPPLSTTEG